MARRKIITSGVDSEYVLSDLAEYLRRDGYEVIELDFGWFKGDVYDLLRNEKQGESVYITSAHSNLTRMVSREISPKILLNYPNYLSPLEILEVLRPASSIYIPHDLLTPYGDTNLNEFRFLDLFDYILSPIADPALQAVVGACTKVIEAGWIKHASLDSFADTNLAQDSGSSMVVTVFVTMFEHLLTKFGPEGVVDYFAPLLTKNVGIKLPLWSGAEDVEKIIRRRFSNQVFPATISSTSIIQNSNIVICNGASSIHAETNLLGRPAICLLDEEGISIKEQRRKLRHLPNIFFHDYRRREGLSESQMIKLATQKTTTPQRRFEFRIVKEILESLN